MSDFGSRTSDNGNYAEDDQMTTTNTLFLISFIVLWGCSKEHSSEPTNSLSDEYRSDSFTLPDAADRAIDVQAAGGSIQMTLTDKNEYRALLTIPQNVSTVIGSGVSKTYSGEFTLANDTVTFDSSGFIVSAIKWNEGSNSLESISPARGAISFTLKKE